MTLVLAVVGAALMFPVLVFIRTATRLTAARREQRLAAIRLIGATPRQATVCAMVESVTAVVFGVGAAMALFLTLRPVLARIPLTGSAFYSSDLSLDVTDSMLVLLGVPLAATAVAWFSVRGVNSAPLRVTRKTRATRTSAWRLLPLVVGLAELAFLAYATNIGDSTQHTNGQQALAYLVGVLLVMTGLIGAGPWLTARGATLMANRADRPATLIAGCRLADSPQAAFRSISGLILALFLGTSTTAVIAAVEVHEGAASPSSASRAALLVQFDNLDKSEQFDGTVLSFLGALDSNSAVSGYTVIRARAETSGVVQVASCTELARTPVLGRCPPGVEAVTITDDLTHAPMHGALTSLAAMTWPAAAETNRDVSSLPVTALVIGSTGATPAVEQIRTTAQQMMHFPVLVQTFADLQVDRKLEGYRQLANAVVFVSLPIAGCGLAVGAVGGLAERRRPFALLRLAGTPLATLRRVVALEAVLPLIMTTVVSVLAGLGTAMLFLHSQVQEPLHGLDLQYCLVMLLGFVGALGIIASTLTAIGRATAPGLVRND